MRILWSNRLIVLRTLSATFLLLLSSCGPKVVLSPDFAKESPLQLAVLPLVASDDFRPQRVLLFSRLIRNQLENSGFQLLEEKIVEDLCSSSDCPERQSLIRDYKIDGFVLINMESTSQNDFGLGFYNEVTASIRIVNAGEQELISVSHTESERGGLLFDSGQVLQGLIEQYGNFGDDRFNALAEKLSRKLVQQVPAPNSETLVAEAEQEENLNISRIDSGLVKSGVYKICAHGTPRSLAWLLIRRNRSNLREVSSGKYCGIFPVYEMLESYVWVELRSAFGMPVRKKLSLRESRLATKRK